MLLTILVWMLMDKSSSFEEEEKERWPWLSVDRNGNLKFEALSAVMLKAPQLEDLKTQASVVRVSFSVVCSFGLFDYLLGYL